MALVGGHRDPEFGPVIVAGLGGGYAEAYHDVTHVHCPARADDVERLLGRTVFGQMLGQGSDRLSSLSGIVSAVSRWFARHPEVVSFDVNPVLLGFDGTLTAVDARVELSAAVI